MLTTSPLASRRWGRQQCRVVGTPLTLTSTWWPILGRPRRICRRCRGRRSGRRHRGPDRSTHSATAFRWSSTSSTSSTRMDSESRMASGRKRQFIQLPRRRSEAMALWTRSRAVAARAAAHAGEKNGAGRRSHGVQGTERTGLNARRRAGAERFAARPRPPRCRPVERGGRSGRPGCIGSASWLRTSRPPSGADVNRSRPIRRKCPTAGRRPPDGAGRHIGQVGGRWRKGQASRSSRKAAKTSCSTA